MKKNKLLLLTSTFPYGKGESFLETEILYLAKEFNVIYIKPFITAVENSRSLPENVVVLSPIANNAKKEFFKGVLPFSLSFLWFSLVKIFFSFKHESYFKHKINTYFFLNLIYKNDFKDFLRKEKQIDVVYSYWSGVSALSIIFIRNYIKTSKIISRIHGSDLYLKKDKYFLPLRDEFFSCLDELYFISKQGMDYFLINYPNYENIKYKLSYLGTLKKKRNINDEVLLNDSNYDFHLVSCSYIVDVKRLDLIFDALKGFDEFNLKWTHIGGGNRLEEFRMKSKKITNHSFDFLGDKKNSEVYEFYKINQVDCFINVSSSEGLPVSIMEVISFNIPVIATNVGGISEIVNKNSGILLSANPDSNEIKGAILKMSKQKMLFTPYEVWRSKFNADENYNSFSKQINVK